MDTFICPHCGKELDLGSIFPDESNFFGSYCTNCERLYYLNGQKEIYLDVFVGMKE